MSSVPQLYKLMRNKHFYSHIHSFILTAKCMFADAGGVDDKTAIWQPTKRQRVPPIQSSLTH